jgi:hypothetical protein
MSPHFPGEEVDEEELAVEYELNLDKIPKIGNDGHNFVKRGIVVTCDGAGTHPPHRHVIK